MATRTLSLVVVVVMAVLASPLHSSPSLAQSLSFPPSLRLRFQPLAALVHFAHPASPIVPQASYLYLYIYVVSHSINFFSLSSSICYHHSVLRPSSYVMAILVPSALPADVLFNRRSSEIASAFEFKKKTVSADDDVSCSTSRSIVAPSPASTRRVPVLFWRNMATCRIRARAVPSLRRRSKFFVHFVLFSSPLTLCLFCFIASITEERSLMGCWFRVTSRYSPRSCNVTENDCFFFAFIVHRGHHLSFACDVVAVAPS